MATDLRDRDGIAFFAVHHVHAHFAPLLAFVPAEKYLMRSFWESLSGIHPLEIGVSSSSDS